MIHGTFVEAVGQFGEQIDFLSRAIGNDETRPAFSYILIEPSEKKKGKLRGITTDGRRMHIVDTLACPDSIGIEKGWWRFLKSTTEMAWLAKIIADKNEPMAFPPSYKKIIPTEKPNFQTTFDPEFSEGRISKHDLVKIVRFVNSFPKPTPFDPTYLYDLGSAFWDVAWYDQCKSVVFENGSRKAVIMPLHYDEED